MEQKKDVMRKSPALYITMLVIWTVLTVFLWLNFIPKIVDVPFRAGRAISLGGANRRTDTFDLERNFYFLFLAERRKGFPLRHLVLHFPQEDAQTLPRRHRYGRVGRDG